MADGISKIVPMGTQGCVTTIEHLLCMNFLGISYHNGPSGAETLAVGGVVLRHMNTPTCL